MKLNIRMYNAAPGSPVKTPSELQAAAKVVAELLATLLRLHGIRSLTATPTLVGSCTVLDKSFVALGEPPAALVAIRKEAVTRLTYYMSLFGITYLEIEPSDDEMKVITDTWVQLAQAGVALQADMTAKSPPAVDPTGKPVMPPVQVPG